MSKVLSNNNTTFVHLFSLSLLWLIGIMFVGYSGEFPLNDDWAYTHNVQHLVEQGEIYFSDWPAMTLIGQTLWGALFCKFFGFSFVVLRLSTLLAAWITVLSSYFLFARLSPNRSLAFWGALLLASNPLFFSLSFTFMTDIHFLCCSILSIFFYIRYRQDNQKWDWVWATFFAMWATLIRQMGILLPVIYSIHLLYNHRWTIPLFFRAALPVFLALGTLVAYTSWRGHYYGFPPQYGSLSLLFYPLKHAYFYKNLLIRPGILLCYLAMFWLPVVLVQLPQLWKNSLRWQKITALISTFILILIFYRSWEFIPHGNIFYNLGLGPQVLKDTDIDVNLPVELSSFGLFPLRVLFVLAGSLLSIFLFLKYLPKKGRTYTGLQLGAILMGFAYTFYLMLDGHFFDRYYLFLFPLMGILVLPTKKISYPKWVLVLGIAFQLGYGGFSLMATHDYLSWNRARWEALDYLTTQKNISPNQIDGGFEFNGWYQTHLDKRIGFDKVSWWFVDQDQYTITQDALPFYQTFYSTTSWQWLKMSTDSIFVLTKTKPQTTDTIWTNLNLIDTSQQVFLTNLDSFVLQRGDLVDSTVGFLDSSSILLVESNAFGLTRHFNDIQAPENWNIRIWRKSPNQEGGIVLSAPDPKAFYVFGKTVLKDSLGWQLIELETEIPDSYTSSELDFYIWNNSKDSIWFDNLEIIRKKY